MDITSSPLELVLGTNFLWRALTILLTLNPLIPATLDTKALFPIIEPADIVQAPVLAEKIAPILAPRAILLAWSVFIKATLPTDLAIHQLAELAAINVGIADADTAKSPVTIAAHPTPINICLLCLEIHLHTLLPTTFILLSLFSLFLSSLLFNFSSRVFL